MNSCRHLGKSTTSLAVSTLASGWYKAGPCIRTIGISRLDLVWHGTSMVTPRRSFAPRVRSSIKLPISRRVWAMALQECPSDMTSLPRMGYDNYDGLTSGLRQRYLLKVRPCLEYHRAHLPAIPGRLQCGDGLRCRPRALRHQFCGPEYTYSSCHQLEPGYSESFNE